MQDWADVIDVIYEVLSLENTASGPNVLNHQELLLSPSECRQCSPSKFRHFSRCWRKQEVLWRFQEENLIFLSIPLSLLNVKHPQKILGTHILRGRIHLGITSEVVPDGLFSS